LSKERVYPQLYKKLYLGLPNYTMAEINDVKYIAQNEFLEEKTIFSFSDCNVGGRVHVISLNTLWSKNELFEKYQETTI